MRPALTPASLTPPRASGRFLARDYAAFGGTLRSALHFPDLPERSVDSPHWTLRIGSGAPPHAASSLLGERHVGQETYRLWSITGGLRLEYVFAGAFDITANGSTICWYPCADPHLELARAIVTGPVLALALEAAGAFCLHGSAVAFGDRGVGFLAPKHHGKSTLAVALAAAGAAFIGDDTLAISPGNPTTVRPGTGSVRLWDDSARELRISELFNTVIPGVKTTATDFARAAVVRHPVPLDAVYVLAPVAESGMDEPVRRRRLNPGEATVSLAHHAKLPDSLVGLRAAGSRLRTAVAVASSVPMYSLEIRRGFAHLPAVVGQLANWHDSAAVPSGPTQR